MHRLSYKVFPGCFSWLPDLILLCIVSLTARLQNSQYGNEEDIRAMLESFEQHAKPTFKDERDRSYIKFGSLRDKDPAVGIRSGQLTLDGYVLTFPCYQQTGVRADIYTLARTSRNCLPSQSRGSWTPYMLSGLPPRRMSPYVVVHFRPLPRG